MHNILSEFDIQTDNIISTRRPDIVKLTEKKKKERKESVELLTSPFQLTTRKN